MLQKLFFLFDNGLKKIGYRVKYVVLSSDQKTVELCVYKRLYMPCEVEIKTYLEALGYQIHMIDGKSDPNELLVECSLNLESI